MSSPAAKKQRTEPQYELLYHPGIPGRGEYIRLLLEAAGAPYTDVANDIDNGYSKVQAASYPERTSDDEGPPCFCPPVLRVPGAGKGGKALLIHQTPNILLYLGKQTGMTPEDEIDQLFVNQLALTALDLCNEVHDTHHPVAVAEYYESQKDEALRKAKDVRANRLPKFFNYAETALKNNESGVGKYFVGDRLTYADTTWWQVLDGIYFAFPEEMKVREKEYPLLFDTFFPNVKQEKGIKEYLASKRRLPYSQGIFRHYPELDR